MTNKNLDNILSNNFFDFWSNFLFFLVLRTQKINEVIGNPIDGIIIQIICWHHLLLTMENLPSEEQKFASFDKTLSLWKKELSLNKLFQKNNDKNLTISTVSTLAAIPFETTRRRLKKLEKDGWIKISRKTGISYVASEKLDKKIVIDIHETEKNLLKKYLKI